MSLMHVKQHGSNEMHLCLSNHPLQLWSSASLGGRTSRRVTQATRPRGLPPLPLLSHSVWHQSVARLILQTSLESPSSLPLHYGCRSSPRHPLQTAAAVHPFTCLLPRSPQNFPLTVAGLCLGTCGLDNVTFLVKASSSPLCSEG